MFQNKEKSHEFESEMESLNKIKITASITTLGVVNSRINSAQPLHDRWVIFGNLSTLQIGHRGSITVLNECLMRETWLPCKRDETQRDASASSALMHTYSELSRGTRTLWANSSEKLATLLERIFVVPWLRHVGSPSLDRIEMRYKGMKEVWNVRFIALRRRVREKMLFIMP